MTHTIPGECPTPEELGRAGWTLLHATAATFPNHPTPTQQRHLHNFIHAFSHVYPCAHCAYYLRRDIERHPPVVTSKREASRYICTIHNKVNKNLGREIMDCDPDVVLKRWHPTYPQMEDVPTIEEQIEEQKRKAAAAAAASSSSSSQSSSGKGGGKWGFLNFGASDAKSTRGTSAAAASPQSSPGVVTDNETDISKIMQRIEGCQVYCPEKKA